MSFADCHVDVKNVLSVSRKGAKICWDHHVNTFIWIDCSPYFLSEFVSHPEGLYSPLPVFLYPGKHDNARQFFKKKKQYDRDILIQTHPTWLRLPGSNIVPSSVSNLPLACDHGLESWEILIPEASPVILILLHFSLKQRAPWNTVTINDLQSAKP